MSELKFKPQYSNQVDQSLKTIDEVIHYSLRWDDYEFILCAIASVLTKEQQIKLAEKFEYRAVINDNR